ncbi:cryptochrome/photolyase family protein [Brevibacterium yomogidense]|uniref:cryptochrome/photolyase family protein n=1 Tax=Brevibacterium yomogidense TaxID=946573 RepID=UPI001E6269E9|nr:deoxyribodipyrimidine photo-lyase [Brevibacterium yomogidense]
MGDGRDGCDRRDECDGPDERDGDRAMALWWVRDDLRLADNPALLSAARTGTVVALHIDEEVAGARTPGAASRWWLHHSLTALAEDIRQYGVPLVLAAGDPCVVVPEVVQEVEASHVVWNRRYHRPHRDVDAALMSRLREDGVAVESFAAFLLHEPWTVTKDDGSGYKVYSAFARACRSRPEPREPHPRPRELRGPVQAGEASAGDPGAAVAGYPGTSVAGDPGTTVEGDLSATVAGRHLSTWFDADGFADALGERGWLPTAPDWAGGLRQTWTPGEAAARARLEELGDVLDGYDQRRDRPDQSGTSLLSPRLRFGELSPHEVWHRNVEFASEAMSSGDAEAFRGELLWREFAWHRRAVLPQLDSENIRPEFDDFAWDDDPQALRAWQRGRTGVPLVDAGMRELWETGYMHNRVRMVTASFLVKNLLQDWRKGEQWFWDTLVDADEGANPFNWQWVAGSGDDAAPYFRIFNPHRQAERFDPLGVYVDRWVPREEQEREPIVDVAQSRREALAEYRRVKN